MRISILGFAQRPWTEVLPTCSITLMNLAGEEGCVGCEWRREVVCQIRFDVGELRGPDEVCVGS